MPSNSQLLRWLLILVVVIALLRLIDMIVMAPMIGTTAAGGFMTGAAMVWGAVSMVLGAVILALLIVFLLRVIRRV
jgi:uncharacterized membrane protein